MRHPIAATKVAKEVKRLAEEHPDAVYRGRCSYVYGRVENGPPTTGCLIGHALRAIQPDIDDYLESKHCDAVSVEGLVEARIISGAHVAYELDVVQTRQDQGETWSEAVRGLL